MEGLYFFYKPGSLNLIWLGVAFMPPKSHLVDETLTHFHFITEIIRIQIHESDKIFKNQRKGFRVEGICG